MWWTNDSGRVGREKAAVEALSGEGWFTLTRWCMHRFLLAAEGVISARGAQYPVRLVYPDQFPHVPAWVEPQDGKARWSQHQYGDGGILCLELRPDNWHPEATGADVLKSAFHLLEVENPEGEGEQGVVASGHNIGNLQSYDWGAQPVFLGYGFAVRLLSDDARGIAALRWGRRDDVSPALIFDSVDRDRPKGGPSFELGSFRLEVPVVVARVAAPQETPSTRAALAEALGCQLDPEVFDGAVMVIAVTEASITVYDSPKQDSVAKRFWFLLPDDEGQRSDRAEQAINKRVAIVGIGSVGSRLAEILVRSGIHNLTLVDGDVVLPSNLERHALDWRDVGFRKANAMRRRLLEIVPGAKIDVVPANLNWQRSAKVQAEQVDRRGSWTAGKSSGSCEVRSQFRGIGCSRD